MPNAWSALCCGEFEADRAFAILGQIKRPTPQAAQKVERRLQAVRYHFANAIARDAYHIYPERLLALAESGKKIARALVSICEMLKHKHPAKVRRKKEIVANATTAKV